jgi:hypothetical protein
MLAGSDGVARRQVHGAAFAARVVACSGQQREDLFTECLSFA